MDEQEKGLAQDEPTGQPAADGQIDSEPAAEASADAAENSAKEAQSLTEEAQNEQMPAELPEASAAPADNITIPQGKKTQTLAVDSDSGNFAAAWCRSIFWLLLFPACADGRAGNHEGQSDRHPRRRYLFDSLFAVSVGRGSDAFVVFKQSEGCNG